MVHVGDMPQERDRSIRLVGEVTEIGDSTGAIHPCSGKILLYLHKDSIAKTVRYGDMLLVLATPEEPSCAQNPHQFDYRKHLARKGILYTDYLNSSNYRVVDNRSTRLVSQFARLRQKIIDVIHHSSLSPSRQGIVEAMFLGWDDDLDHQTKMHFQRAGITHLLCVSGLHVGIVAWLAGLCLFFLSNRRPSRIVKGCFKLVVIWAFVLLTGMAPATVRAGIMFSFMVAGKMFFSQPSSLNALAASALIMLSVNPLMLFDVGFQLSYSAVVGLVVMMPPLTSLLSPKKHQRRVVDLLMRLLLNIYSWAVSSVVAQLSKAPFVLYYFHRFPTWFLVANMTIVPFATLLLAGIILMVAFAWWPWAFKAIGTLLSGGLSATEWIYDAIARWPMSMIGDIYFDLPMLAISLAALVMTALAITARRWGTLVIALLLFLTLAVYSRHINHRAAEQLCFDIYNVGNHTAIEFFEGRQSVLLCDSAIARSPAMIDYQTSGNLLWHRSERVRTVRLDSDYEDDWLWVANRFVGFAGTTMRIVDRSNVRQKSLSHPSIDLLLLCESPYITVAELMEQYHFDTLVIASQNSRRRKAAWQQECDSLQVPYKLYP